ncbi:MAG: hypothetical protein ACOYLO_10730 [Ferruginibacter sp.]
MATLSSGYAVSAPVYLANPGYWSFVAPQSPSIKMTNVPVQQPLTSNIVESYGVFKPLGAAKTIIVAGSIYGVDGSYEITVQGDTDWAELETILLYQGILHVHDPLGRQKYVRFVDRNYVESGPINNLIRTVKVNYYEVDAP